jgi:heme oxygenase
LSVGVNTLTGVRAGLPTVFGTEGVLRMDMRLSKLIESATVKLQKIYDNSGILNALRIGSATVDDYTTYLLNQHEIYRTLEWALEHQWYSPTVEPIYRVGLLRSKAIEQDLLLLLGRNWPDRKPLDLTSLVTLRLREVVEEFPYLLGAHAYAFYIDVLSRSVSMRELLSARYGISDMALSIYKFDHIGSVPSFMEQYKKAFDLLPLSELKRHRFVSEVKLALTLMLGISLEIVDSRSVSRHGSLTLHRVESGAGVDTEVVRKVESR